jgi:hypothetical protein
MQNAVYVYAWIDGLPYFFSEYILANVDDLSDAAKSAIAVNLTTN